MLWWNIETSTAVPQSWRPLQASLLNVALRQRYFLKNFTISAEQWYWKMHQDGYFWRQFCFRNIPQWLLLKDSCKDIFILEILGYILLLFLLWRHVKEELIFMNSFLSEGFGEKCKHTELALNFIQKQYFS